jgi:hypothetical protein
MAHDIRRIDGFDYRWEEDKLLVSFQGEPSHSAFMALLASTPGGSELHFFDRFYPTISDPGAYVRVQRKGDEFIYYLANHGWSNDWQRQSIEMIAAWIALNARSLRARGNPLREVRVEPASVSPFNPR